MKCKVFSTVDCNQKLSLMSIHARVWRDNENGNPYFAYVATLMNERSAVIHVVRSMDYGSMNKDNVLKTALFCIKKQFPFVSVGKFNYLYRKGREKELEHPENWLDLASGIDVVYVKNNQYCTV